MNADFVGLLQGHWMWAHGEMKKRWNRLSDDDFRLAAGRREALAALLQDRYGYACAQALDEVDRCLTDFGNRLLAPNVAHRPSAPPLS